MSEKIYSRRSPAAEEHRADTTESSDTPTYTEAFARDRAEPLDAEDRLDAAVLAAASERGFRLAVRCTRCGQWLVADRSVRNHIGPVCAAKRTKSAA